MKTGRYAEPLSRVEGTGKKLYNPLMSTIRAFIAVQLADEAKDALGKVTRILSGRVERNAVRWVRPAQMHLTLRFLGDTDTAKLPAIQAAMDAVAASNTSFEMRLGGIGCFPNRNRPRVIWVGLSGKRLACHLWSPLWRKSWLISAGSLRASPSARI